MSVSFSKQTKTIVQRKLRKVEYKVSKEMDNIGV
jgi:hypothetical protein